MDLSLTTVAARPVPDLRPAADAEATERIAAPPASLALGPAIAPTSASQMGWAARSLLEPTAELRREGLASANNGEGPKRVLKPYGILMLPSDEPPRHGSDAAEEKAAIEAERIASPAPLLDEDGRAAPEEMAASADQAEAPTTSATGEAEPVKAETGDPV